jgi:SulP family sulfate permease
VVFVITYSRIPLADLATNLSLFTSSVVRADHEVETLREHGRKTLLYRLSGYVFFGSASKIETVFRTMDEDVEAFVLDFTNVSGIDSSAISVFQRILRRYYGKTTQFHFVYSADNEASVRSIAQGMQGVGQIHYHTSLDHALEIAEEQIIAKWANGAAAPTSFAFLGSTGNQQTFLNYCELREIKSGERLCLEHERSDEIFFIASGAFEVIKATANGEVRLAKLQQGAMVGELAFYTGEARSASIAAASDATVYVLRKSALKKLRMECPDLAETFDHIVIRRISHALTRTNKLVALYK